MVVIFDLLTGDVQRTRAAERTTPEVEKPRIGSEPAHGPALQAPDTAMAESTMPLALARLDCEAFIFAMER